MFNDTKHQGDSNGSLGNKVQSSEGEYSVSPIGIGGTVALGSGDNGWGFDIGFSFSYSSTGISFTVSLTKMDYVVGAYVGYGRSASAGYGDIASIGLSSPSTTDYIGIAAGNGVMSIGASANIGNSGIGGGGGVGRFGDGLGAFMVRVRHEVLL